ncbi:hypothetical protein COL516b_000663 [Colletotrichum fioriniae]|nr:uncharacterized protein COL516b_000663 [Colletotrichum fioriniae]KAJ0313722.1 hypothetical protein COL516b_000663 [Colletotrichum fioriniae]
MAHTDTVDRGFITGPVNKGDGKEYSCLSHVVDLYSTIDRHLDMEVDYKEDTDSGSPGVEYEDDDEEDDQSTGTEVCSSPGSDAMTDDGNKISDDEDEGDDEEY